MQHVRRSGARDIAKRSRAGFTLLEVAISLLVFLSMVLMFAAVFPLAIRGAHYSSNYSQAALLAQHKIDQIRGAGSDKLMNGAAATNLIGLNIVDNTTANSTQTSFPYSLTFTTVDNLVDTGDNSGFFPPGSTGTVVIKDFHDCTSAPCNAAIPAGQEYVINVKIAWQGGGTSPGYYESYALIGSYIPG